MVSSNIGDWSQLLLNKVVFVTGGAGHIGRCIAKTCYAHGACVVLGDLDPTSTNKIKDEILLNQDKKEDRILVVKLDITDESSIQQAVKAIVDKWKTIHVLLNVAAAFEFGSVEEVSAERWSRSLDVNVRGCASMVKYVAPILKKQNSGSIINIASTLGVIAMPNTAPYAASKAAVIQLTRNLALDLGAFNIRVNSISPGLINVPSVDAMANQVGLTSEQIQNICSSTNCLKRNGEAQEIANLVIFLASDLCQFMTGASLIVDGGGTIM